MHVWAHMKPEANTEQVILSRYCVWFLEMERSVQAWQQMPLPIEAAHWPLDIFDEHNHIWKFGLFILSPALDAESLVDYSH